MGMMPGLVDLAKEHGRHKGDESPNPLFLASVPNGPGRPGFGKAGPGLSKFSRI